MLRHGVNKWQSIGVEGNLLSRAVDDGTAATIVLKWQQYLTEQTIATSETTQNHVNAFIAQFANDLDAMLVRYSSSPQMAKGLVHSIITNHGKKLSLMSQTDEASDGLGSQFTNSNSTIDFATMQRPRGGSLSSASTSATSKYDHLASILRMDIVKHSFYGSPEREESPLASQTVSELPSPETSELSRKFIQFIDEEDIEFLVEAERSTLEVLEWSNGLNEFRKAAPQTDIDQTAHDFRFLHPMSKQLFPPVTHPLRTASPVRAVLPSHKVCPSPHHSPNHTILSTIVESVSESAIISDVSRSEVGESLSSGVQSAHNPPLDAAAPLSASNTSDTLVQTCNLVFPDVVYETREVSPSAAHRGVEQVCDMESVGSSLSATSTVRNSKRAAASVSVSADLIRRKMQRKQKNANKKRKEKVTAMHDRAVSAVVEDCTAEESMQDVLVDVTEVTAPSSPIGDSGLTGQPHTPLAGENVSPSPTPPSSSATFTPTKAAGPETGPSASPVKNTVLRHKAENELTVSVVRFLLPFLLCILLYTGGRYSYKTQTNIWQDQTRLHGAPQKRVPDSPASSASNVKVDPHARVQHKQSMKPLTTPPAPRTAAPPLLATAKDPEGTFSLHVSIRGLDGPTHSEHGRTDSGGASSLAAIYGGKFNAFRHAWVRIKGVLFLAARTVAAPVRGLFSIFRL